MISEVIRGDCREVLCRFPDDSIDLIVTSPPYSDQRKRDYGGVSPDEYVDWFLPIGRELLRVLKPDGSFVLNIKERMVDGERHTYVLDLIKGLRMAGWFWIEEYIWYKKNSMPGKWPTRFRDGWERLLHFTKSKRFRMYQDEVMVPVKESTRLRANQMLPNDDTRICSKTGSNFGKNMSNWRGREFVYPDNVLFLPSNDSKSTHSVAFPAVLPEWFIKLFTLPGDMVLDPFAGSGTTGVVAKRMGRGYIMIEQNDRYYDLCCSEIAQVTAPGMSFLDLKS